MSRKLTIAFAATALLCACPDEKKPDENGGSPDTCIPASDGGCAGPVDPGAGGPLGNSDIRAACTEYQAMLAASPGDRQAAFGAALSCSLNLLDAPAITEFLDTCGQPHLEIHSQLFGPNGAFAQDKLARQGSGVPTLAKRQGQTGTFTPVAFAPGSWRARVQTWSYTEYPSGQTINQRKLEVRVSDFASYPDQMEQVSVEVSVDMDNVSWSPTGEHRPLTNGLELPVMGLNGGVNVRLPQPSGQQAEWFSNPESGSILFRKVGTGRVGDAVEIEFKNVVVTGYPNCPNGPCDPSAYVSVQVNGTVSATISGPTTLTLPFADLRDDQGPPRREAAVVLIDSCPNLSMEYLRGQLVKLVGELDRINGWLAIVVDGAGAESFSFKVPAGLFFAEGEVALNVTDARLFKSAVDGLLALGRGATQYKVLVKSFDQLMGRFIRWEDQMGTPTPVDTRDFVMSLLVEELNLVFLDRQDGFDLNPSRAHLVRMLDDLSAAFTKEPAGAGVFNFQAPYSRALAADLDAQLRFLRSSLDNEGLQGFPHSPEYKINLHRLFANPIDKATLHAASTGGNGIFLLEEGDLAAPYAYDRNDEMRLDEDGVKSVAETVFKTPVDYSGQVCTPNQSPSGCPTGYSCVGVPTEPGVPPTGWCDQPSFVLVDDSAVDQAGVNGDDPAFINQAALKPLQIVEPWIE